MRTKRLAVLGLVLAVPGVSARAQDRDREVVIYDAETNRKLDHEELSARQRRMLDTVTEELGYQSPDGGEPAGCVAGSGLVYCWAFGYICLATVTPFVTLTCAQCFEPSHCE